MFTWSKHTAIAAVMGLASSVFALPAAADANFDLGRSATEAEINA